MAGDEAPQTAVFVMALDGSQMRKVAQVDQYREHGSPRWSHDGRRLAFDAYNSPTLARKFFAIDVDGTALIELGENAMPDWSPDDKQLAYQHYGGGGVKYGIWVQNLDGRGRDWVTRGVSPRWSPDASKMAFTDGEGLKVLDLVSLETQSLLDESFRIVNVGFDWAPDGNRLAFVGNHNGVSELFVISAEGSTKGLASRATGDLSPIVSWSPDGKRIAFSRGKRILVIDADGPAEARPIPGQQANNQSPAFSPDGKWLAFVSDQKTLAAPQKPMAGPPRLQLLSHHRKGTNVFSVAFTPDGRRVVIGGDATDGGVQLWNPASGEIDTIAGDGVTLALSGDGRRVALAPLVKGFKIVDVGSRAVVHSFNRYQQVVRLAFSKDSTRVLAGIKRSRIWDADTGEHVCEVLGHGEWVTACAFSPDGKEAITASLDQTVRVASAIDGKPRLKIEHPAPVWGLAVTPDGKRILSGTGGQTENHLLDTMMLKNGGDNVLRIWDSASGKLLGELRGHTHAVVAIDVFPGGRWAVSGSYDGTLRLWDLDLGTQLSQVDGQGCVTSVAVSPDGRQVVAGGGSRRLAGEDVVEFPDEQVRLFKVLGTAVTELPTGGK
jgi:WD40 repeat protein